MAGQFEKLIGIMNQSMYKAIGNGQLRWYELEEVILDVETTLNNRPLGYVEDDKLVNTTTLVSGNIFKKL